jgi:hypothetical protein
MIYLFLWLLVHYVIGVPALVGRLQKATAPALAMRALLVYALTPLWPVAVLLFLLSALSRWMWEKLARVGEYPFRAWETLHAPHK